MKKMTKTDLEKLATLKEQNKPYIKVGMSTCGMAAGAEEVMNTLKTEAKQHGATIDIKQCGCLGMCSVEPLVEVYVEGLPAVTYGKVDKEVAVKIIEEHVIAKRLLNDYIFDLPLSK